MDEVSFSHQKLFNKYSFLYNTLYKTQTYFLGDSYKKEGKFFRPLT